jgi:DHA1 family purine ribonucleoside efflux pump-like MFS transporter
MSDVASSPAVVDPQCSAKQERASWPAVFSLAFGAFGLVTAELLPVSILTPMATELDASNGEVGQAVTATAIIAAFAGPLIVLGSGRIDRRVIVWALMALLIVSSVLSAFATSVEFLLLARGILGFALGGYWAMMTALALRLVPSEQMPRAVSIILMGVSLATVFAAPLAAALGELWGWRATFFAVAGIGIVSLLLQFTVLPGLPSTGGADLASFRAALSRRAVLIGIGTAIVVVSGHFAGFTFIRPFLEVVPKLSISTISLALLAFGVGGFLGNVVAGAIAARSPALAVGGSSLLIAAAALALVLQGHAGHRLLRDRRLGLRVRGNSRLRLDLERPSRSGSCRERGRSARFLVSGRHRQRCVHRGHSHRRHRAEGSDRLRVHRRRHRRSDDAYVGPSGRTKEGSNGYAA